MPVKARDNLNSINLSHVSSVVEMTRLISRNIFSFLRWNSERYTTNIPARKGITLTKMADWVRDNKGKYWEIISAGMFFQINEMPCSKRISLKKRYCDQMKKKSEKSKNSSKTQNI